MATELRPDIQSAKDRISTRMGAGREFKKLESYLWEGEVVDCVCVGQYGRGTGLLVLTNSRLLFLVDGMTGSTFEDFPLSKISSVQWSSGFVQGTLTVYASGNKAEITNVAKPDGPPLADKLRAILAGHTAPVASAPPMFAAAPPPPPPPPPPAVPAGWYPDAQNPNLQRYWDGRGWTEHTAPA